MCKQHMPALLWGRCAGISICSRLWLVAGTRKRMGHQKEQCFQRVSGFPKTTKLEGEQRGTMCSNVSPRPSRRHQAEAGGVNYKATKCRQYRPSAAGKT
jgi:hypothetical protein